MLDVKELLELFITFFKIGLVSFGGGYAMLPLIDREVSAHHWLEPQQFIDVIAVAGMAPGPIATNSAILVGYNVAGIGGATAATLGMVLPSLLVILIVAAFFFRIQEYSLVQAAFYGLRPVISGLIFFAAITFALRNGLIGGAKGVDWAALVFFGISMVLFFSTRIHPVFVIVLSGAGGMLLFH